MVIKIRPAWLVVIVPKVDWDVMIGGVIIIKVKPRISFYLLGHGFHKLLDGTKL